MHYRFLDPKWLREVSLNDDHIQDSLTQAFLSSIPGMLGQLQDALNNNSAHDLRQSVDKVCSVASLFTQVNFNERFLALTSEYSNTLSPYSILWLKNILKDLAVLQEEVKVHYNQSKSVNSRVQHLA